MEKQMNELNTLIQQTKEEIEKCNICKNSCYSLDFFGTEIFVCREHLIELKALQKGYQTAQDIFIKMIDKLEFRIQNDKDYLNKVKLDGLKEIKSQLGGSL